MHFAQVAFALLTGGAAILIVAGLVLESLHDKTRVALRDNTQPLITSTVRRIGDAPGSETRDDAAANETPRPSDRRKRRGKKGASGEDDRTARRRRRQERRTSRSDEETPAEHQRMESETAMPGEPGDG
jgi:hypothetical protein